MLQIGEQDALTHHGATHHGVNEAAVALLRAALLMCRGGGRQNRAVFVHQPLGKQLAWVRCVREKQG